MMNGDAREQQRRGAMLMHVKEGERWSGEGESTERSSPVSSIMLRRVIPIEGSLTTAYRSENGMREVEAVLGVWCEV
jgi:hypothetical protein